MKGAIAPADVVGVTVAENVELLELNLR